jgi:hypothetical protein
MQIKVLLLAVLISIVQAAAAKKILLLPTLKTNKQREVENHELSNVKFTC